MLFVDAALDSRVFTLAHARLALYQVSLCCLLFVLSSSDSHQYIYVDYFQAALWSWGSTLGIPTIDYYIMPRMLVCAGVCPVLLAQTRMQENMGKPQQYFVEQVSNYGICKQDNVSLASVCL
jgi:hypothetical protein